MIGCRVLQLNKRSKLKSFNIPFKFFKNARATSIAQITLQIYNITKLFIVLFMACKKI